jgi:hypothetical protein
LISVPRSAPIPAAGRLLFLTVFLTALSFGQPQTLIVPQIADGGGWQTTLVLTNMTTGSGSAGLTFYQETSGGATQSWNPPFQEAVAQNVPVAAGSTVFLHTMGTSSATSVGWAQIIVSPGIAAYAIFTQRIPGQADQDGTAAGGAVAERFLVPFDNTAGFVTSVAMVNQVAAVQRGGTENNTISVNIRIETGATSQSSITLPAQGHMAFAFADRFPVTSGHRGLAEFYIARGSLSMIALRFNPTGAFTTAPAYSQSGAPVVGVTPPPSQK